MGVLLVAAEWRVGGHRPAMREIGVGVRTADVVDPAQLFRDRFRPEIERPHRIDEAERPALLARAIVRQYQDQGIVALAGGFKKINQPRQVPVGMIEHAGKGRLQPREHTLLVRTVLVPGFYPVIACRHFGLLRHNPHRLLSR